MFDGIARRYDLLNHLLSANFDRRWRRRAAREVPADEALTVLDLCGGTGDLSVELARAVPARTVFCCDFSHHMLTLAATKFDRKKLGDRCLPLEADGLRLPLADGSVDAVTVAFGVRNFSDMGTGFREISRILRPGGRCVVLEFSRPTAPGLKQLYAFYLRRILPRIGNGVSGRSGPYTYLARTIADFPEPARLAGEIREAGFAACGWTTLSGGIVALHTAFKAPR
jgi:demethylmenaquinone methyltransferase/2-methoxy-6-polyprenyl-1,4-benzoquinol methylase